MAPSTSTHRNGHQVDRKLVIPITRGMLIDFPFCINHFYQFLFSKDWTELTRYRYRDGIPRPPERPWTEPTWAIRTYFERRGNHDDWIRVYDSERWEQRYELPMVNDVGSKLI